MPNQYLNAENWLKLAIQIYIYIFSCIASTIYIFIYELNSNQTQGSILAKALNLFDFKVLCIIFLSLVLKYSKTILIKLNQHVVIQMTYFE